MMKKEQKEKKICYIMQKRAAGTHMDYVYEMARTLHKEKGLPLTLFIEKGECAPEDMNWCVVQTFRFAPLRIFENFIRILFFRFSGHTIFYIHYSFLSAISAGVVTKIFGGTVFYWNCGQPWMYKRPFLTDLYQKLAYRLIDYLVTGVEAVVPGYMKTYGLKREQIHVIPNWIDLNAVNKNPEVKKNIRTELKIPQDAKILLFLHTLSTRYGAEFLPEILEHFKDENVHLVVAGDGFLRGELEREFSERGISSQVTMLGYVKRNIVEQLLNAADVFIMPSEGAGSPHSLIEAMAYQLPFVAFDVGGVRDTIPPKTNYYIYEYGNISGLVGGIRSLVFSDESYKTFQKLEEEHVTQFNKNNIVSKYFSLLKK